MALGSVIEIYKYVYLSFHNLFINSEMMDESALYTGHWVSFAILVSCSLFSASWYVTECLTQIVQKLKELRPRSRMSTWHHENARPRFRRD